VKALKLLSADLQKELQYELCLPYLIRSLELSKLWYKKLRWICEPYFLGLWQENCGVFGNMADLKE